MSHLRIAALLPIVLSACGDDGPLSPVYPWDDRPVDGQFRVRVIQEENTCAEAGPGPEEAAVIDMFLRTDGLYDLRHGIWWLPLDFTVEGISREGGNINHAKSWKSEYSGTYYAYSLRGRLTPDEMDLEVFFSGTDDCVERVRLVGKPRAMLDPTALDGNYVLRMTPLGYVCGDGPEEPGSSWNYVVPISASAPDKVWIRWPDGSYLNPSPPAEDGGIDWRGTLNYPMGFMTLQLEASLRGRYGPGDVDLTLDYKLPEGSEADADCRVRTAYAGQKRIPALSSVDNEYRARFTFINGCTESGQTETEVVESELRLLTQADGSVELWDALNHVLLKNDAGALSVSFGSVEDGFTAVYSGSLSPPLVAYEAEYVLLDETGAPICTLIERVENGHGRYVFE